MTPEFDELYSTDYYVASAATQIVYGTALSSVSQALMDAMCGNANRWNNTLASIVYMEAGEDPDVLPEDYMQSQNSTTIAILVLRAILKHCETVPSLSFVVDMLVPRWQSMLASTEFHRQLLATCRKVFGRKRRPAWSPDRPSAVYALLQRSTGGALRIGVPPSRVDEAVEALKKWSIEPATAPVLGRMPVCIMCLGRCAMREMPNVCYNCDTRMVVFVSTLTHRVVDAATSVVRKCCIDNHNIPADEIADGQLGNGYAVCTSHAAKFPWLRPATNVTAAVAIANTVNRFSCAVARRTACYARRVQRKHR
ncbi:MAG: hypothetical protein EBS90_11560 [Betaproteobacteria bacterium]|nr:hypothetical protein [Betaproteobacteria bacterium]